MSVSTPILIKVKEILMAILYQLGVSLCLDMKKIIYLIAALAIFSTCKHQTTEIVAGLGNQNDTTHNDPIVILPSNDSVCFNTQILPLIMASCAQAGCHDAISKVEDLNLTSYAGIKAMGTGTLITYITKTTGKVMPPQPQPRMDTANINLIKRWIKEGAKNRICNQTSCDTSNVLYSTHIISIMNTYCKGCHNSGNKGGAISLDNYADVKTQTLTGNLICSITNKGCKFMPQGGSSLGLCDMRKIQIWASKNCPQ
jgi:hypothetical protein